MKKEFKLMLGALAVCSLGFTSCSDDDPDNTTSVQITLPDCDIDYGVDLVWTGWDKNEPLILRGFTFTHTAPYPNYFQGFVPAIQSANDAVSYDKQFQVMPKGGTFGVGTPYLVAFWDVRENAETSLQERTCAIAYSGVDASPVFSPMYVKVTNTAYAYHTMLNGNEFTKKFEKGDWFKLIAHGVASNGKEKTAEFYLANIKSDDVAAGIVSDWQTFDLTSLGEVEVVYFTMESSDSGQYGMNTPAYFALDQFTAQMYNY